MLIMCQILTESSLMNWWIFDLPPEKYHIWSYADIMCWSQNTDFTVDIGVMEDPLHNIRPQSTQW